MASVMATANALATYWASLGATYSLHTGNPGSAGANNEVTGGGYSRQTTTWGTASGGIIVGSQLTFAVPAGTVAFMCRWDGTTLRDIIDTTDATITPAGELKVTPRNQFPVVVP